MQRAPRQIATKLERAKELIPLAAASLPPMSARPLAICRAICSSLWKLALLLCALIVVSLLTGGQSRSGLDGFVVASTPAFALFFGAVGVLFLWKGSRRLSFVCGLAVLLLTVVVWETSEYFFLPDSVPGSRAVWGVALLGLQGLALLLLGSRHERPVTSILGSFVATIIVSSSGFLLLGELLSLLTEQNWIGVFGVPLQPALGFFGCGIGMLAAECWRSLRMRRRFPAWFSYAAAVFFWTVTCCLWWGIRAHWMEHLVSMSRAQEVELNVTFRRKLSLLSCGIESFATRLAYHSDGDMDKGEWTRAAENYLSEQRYCAEVCWQRSPEAPGWNALKEDWQALLGQSSEYRTWLAGQLAAAMGSRTTRFSPLFELEEVSLVLLSTPVWRASADQDLLATVLVLDRLLADMTRSGDMVDVLLQKGPSRVELSPRPSALKARWAILPLPGSGALKVQLAPLDWAGSPLISADMILGGGHLMALLLIGLVWFRRHAERRAMDLDRVNHELLRRQKSLELAEERIRRQNAELNRSNQDLQSFAYHASHDLKAPLRRINIVGEWLEEDAGDSLSEGCRKHLEVLRDQAKKMDDMIRDLLQYSRAGRIGNEPEVLDLDEFIPALIEYLAPPAEFKVEIGAELPTVETLRVPLEHVLENLIWNAIKHHDRDRGTIFVDCEARGDHHVFSVRDDGPGIPPRHHQRIFEIFQTLQRADERKGSGMGLALVKRMVNAMGGDVWLESEGKRGTTFFFSVG